MVNTTNHSTPRCIHKTLAMANNSDHWDADSILTKLLALQLSSEPEQSMSHEWDGDDVGNTWGNLRDKISQGSQEGGNLEKKG